MLPDSLQTIGGDAFGGAEFTGRLTLPKSLTSIGKWAFINSQFSGELTMKKPDVQIASDAFDSGIGTSNHFTNSPAK
ncbi:leucine-rich repeat domain-containing protein [Weissella cibaria]|uniref:leucine-rich repeat domain-containing protein n=1 Tax=Weissella cibaria TaxID=137591 RepID=UPI00223B8ECF